MGLTIIIILGIILIAQSVRLKDEKKTSASYSAQLNNLTQDYNKKIEYYEDEISYISKNNIDKIASLKEEFENNITAIQEEYDKKIRHEKEFIESHKEKLLAMSEKELLVNIMLSLEGYSGKIERLEAGINNGQLSQKIDDLKKVSASNAKEVSKMLIDHVDSLNIPEKIDKTYDEVKKTKEELGRLYPAVFN